MMCLVNPLTSLTFIQFCSLLQATPRALQPERSAVYCARTDPPTVCACLALVMEVILPYRKSKLTAYFALGRNCARGGISLGFQWW